MPLDTHSRDTRSKSRNSKQQDAPVSTRALRASVSARQSGHFQPSANGASGGQGERANLLRTSSANAHHQPSAQAHDQQEPPEAEPNFITQPPTSLAQNARTPPMVPKLNLGGAGLGSTPTAPTPPPVPKLNLAKSPSLPTAHDHSTQLEQAHAEIQGLKSENIRLLLDKSALNKRMQELSRTRDNQTMQLQAELAKMKKDHSSAVLEHKAVAAELQQCQQQLSEVAASSKVASTTSEIYTRALSQTVALRMTHAGEMEELQQVMEEKDEAVRMMEGLVLKLQEELQAQQGSNEQVKKVQHLLDSTDSERQHLTEEIEEVRREWALALQENKSLQKVLDERVRAQGALAAEKRKLTDQLAELQASFEQHTKQESVPSRPSFSSTQQPTDLPSALALLERRSIQNEALRRQKREIEDELETALAELQELKDQAQINSALNQLLAEREDERVAQSELQARLEAKEAYEAEAAAAEAKRNDEVQALEQAQQGKHTRPAGQQGQPGRGKSLLRFALRSVARLGMYSVVAVATVAGTHSDQGRGFVDRFTSRGGRAHQAKASLPGSQSEQQEQQGSSGSSSASRGPSSPLASSFFSDGSPERRLSRYC